MLSACLRIPYQPHNQYLLNVDCPVYSKRSVKFNDPVLLEKTYIQAPYSDLNFVYRTQDTYYQVDYYNQFLTSPAEQLHPLISRCLIRAKIFSQVLDSIGVARPRYWLNSTITELYADYRDRNAPKGVIAMQFTLYRQNATDNKSVKLLDNQYRQAILLQRKDSISLMNAWSIGAQNILQTVMQDLYAI